MLQVNSRCLRMFQWAECLIRNVAVSIKRSIALSDRLRKISCQSQDDYIRNDHTQCIEIILLEIVFNPKQKQFAPSLQIIK